MQLYDSTGADHVKMLRNISEDEQNRGLLLRMQAVDKMGSFDLSFQRVLVDRILKPVYWGIVQTKDSNYF